MLLSSFSSPFSALPCDDAGQFVPPNHPPEPYAPLAGFEPFSSREQYEFTALHYERARSKDDVQEVLNIFKAKDIRDGNEAPPLYHSHAEMLNKIDSIPVGEATWHSFSLRYNGPTDAQSAAWKHQKFTVHARNIQTVLANMLSNPAFNGRFDYVAYEEWKESGDRDRLYSDLMSGMWATEESVRTILIPFLLYSFARSKTCLQNMIARDPATHGAMLVPVILGADKTTVSNQTGNTEYHPVYLSIGNMRNEVRRAHRDAIVPIAFLSIPSGIWNNLIP